MKDMIEKIARKFEAENIRYEMEIVDGQKYILFRERSSKAGTELRFVIFTDKDDKDSENQHIHIESDALCHVDSPRLSIYKCLNDLNYKYHYFKFYISNENDIVVKADSIVPYDFSEDAVWELLVRMVIMLSDDAYLALMKVIWE